MWKMLAVAGMASLAIGTNAMAGSDDTRTVSGTVDQSEWGKPGELSINLATGEYSFKPGVWTTPRDEGKRRGPPLNGILAPAALGELNAIVAEAEAAGLVDMQCASIDRSERAQFIVSTGGKREGWSIRPAAASPRTPIWNAGPNLPMTCTRHCKK